MKIDIANLVSPEALPSTGRFELAEPSVVKDLINGAVFVVGGSPDPDLFFTRFRFQGAVIEGALSSRRKYPDRPAVRGDPGNPGLQIVGGMWSTSFGSNGMTDRHFNSRLAIYMSHMIAFRNSVSFSYRIYLWGGRQGVTQFDMPSDEELFRISVAWQNT